MSDHQILPERPQDAALIEPLLDRTFGPDRKAKTVYYLREDRAPLRELCFVARSPQGGLLASIRFWPIRIEATPAILLGPLAVEPDLQGQGLGRALIFHALAEARRLGHELCVVVGDAPYYAPFGFVAATAYGLVLPGPVDPARFQVLELRPGALEGVSGVIGPGAAADLPGRALGGGAVA